MSSTPDHRATEGRPAGVVTAPDPTPAPGGPVPADPVDPDSATWTRPPAGPSEWRADAIGAAGLFAGSVLSMVLGRASHVLPEPASPQLSVLLLAVAVAPLAWRRRWPSAVAVVVAVAFVVAAETSVPETVFLNIALFCAIYTVGAWETDRRRAAIVRGVVVDLMLVWLVVSFFRVAADPPDGEEVSFAPGALTPLAAYMLVQLLINILYFAGAYWFGNHAWTSARDRARLTYRAQQLVAERAKVEAQAVTIERLRIARELHDAVAHHVSLMGVQAAAARTLSATDPDRSAAALEQVEDSAREAITELHGLLGTLREETAAPVPTGDEPVGSLGVERLPDLVADAVAAGTPTSFQVVGQEARLPPLVSLNLYRITQEALTNVRKHAGRDAVADVRLRYLSGAVELEVADDGAGRRRRPAPAAGGLGLVGMRERVATDGGTLHAGPRRGGGYVVRAWVPLAPGGPA